MSKAKKVATLYQFEEKQPSALPFYATTATFLTLCYAFPSEDNPLYPAIHLSYPLPPRPGSDVVQYGKGPKDLIFVGFWTFVLFAVRDFVSQYPGRALARAWGITSPQKQFKFIQQFWQAVYFGFIAVFGLYVMRRTPLWYFNMQGLFDGFPHTTHDAPFKTFYLVHWANWVQQALVTFLGLEKNRKDLLVLAVHHIVTLAAIPLIYVSHMTWFALALIIPHDISDSLLAFGKCISYADPPAWIAMPYFAVFVGAWIYFRHYVSSITFWTLLTRYRPAMMAAYGWQADDQQWKAWLLWGVVVALFGILNILNAYWLFLILRIVAKAASGEVPKDEREEEEDEAAPGASKKVN